MLLFNLVTLFESSVNSEGIETPFLDRYPSRSFESSVNSEGIETLATDETSRIKFESSVNSEGIETLLRLFVRVFCLRAV